MNNWFDWNGKRSTDYGIYVLEQPALTLPNERVTFVDVPGRNGSLTVLEGDAVYEDLVLTAECLVENTTRYDEIAKFLKGSGQVTFANRPGGYYEARIVNQIPFEKILRGNPHRSFAVNFRCKPFWYAKNVTSIIVSSSGSFVTNPGSVYSEPVMTVYGSGDITLMVGTTIIELEGISGSITLDSVLQEAYVGTVTRNSAMSGEFPVLNPGANAISWTGSVSRISIDPHWRYL